MRIIRPIKITDATLISTNVWEAPPSAYSSSTTYAAGDYASTGVVGGLITVWRSVQNNNIGHDPVSDDGTWWASEGTTYSVYQPGTTYAENDLVLSVATHRVYKSLQSANIGKPLNNTTWWQDYEATNPWKVFDLKVGSQTARPGEIKYVLKPGITTGVALLNLDGSTVNIVMHDPVDGEVYNETISLIETFNVVDGYTYCFEEILTKENVSKTDLPPYSTATLTITISGTKSACGEIVVGQVADIGLTQYEPELRTQDFSRKETDDFGNYTILERAFSRRLDAKVVIDNNRINFLNKTLNELRATPVVWIGSEETVMDSSMLFYGFYRDFRVVIPYPNHSDMSLQIEGLT